MHNLDDALFDGKLVYDLGCGTTDLEADLAQRGVHANVIGFDRDQRAILKSDGTAFERRSVVTSLDHLPVESGSADVVLATFSLPYWGETPEQIFSFYRECERVVKRGGLLSIFPIGVFFEELMDTQPIYRERYMAARLGALAIRTSRNWQSLSADPHALTVQRL